MQPRNNNSSLEDPHKQDSVIVDSHNEDSRSVVLWIHIVDPHNKDSPIVDPPDCMDVRMAQSTQKPHDNLMVLPPRHPVSLSPCHPATMTSVTLSSCHTHTL